MKVRHTDITIIQGNEHVVEDIPIPSVLEGEKLIREAYTRALLKAHTAKSPKVILSALGCAQGFPVVGSAKIMTQEILRFLKKGETPIKEIVISLGDEKTYQVFKETVAGYVTHIQTTLGEEPYVTADIIIELPEGIILIERSNPPYGWALPGGFLDPGESLEEAAIREAKEETNMDLEDLKQFHTYSKPGRDPRFHTVSTVFIAQGKGTPQFGDDAKGLKIVACEDLLNRSYAFDHKDIIRDYLEYKKGNN